MVKTAQTVGIDVNSAPLRLSAKIRQSQNTFGQYNDFYQINYITTKFKCQEKRQLKKGKLYTLLKAEIRQNDH